MRYCRYIIIFGVVFTKIFVLPLPIFAEDNEIDNFLGQETNPTPLLASSNSIVNENISSNTVEESVPLVVPSSSDSTSAGQASESFVDYAALATPLDNCPFSGNSTVTSWPNTSPVPSTPFFNPANFNQSQPPATTKLPTFSHFAANSPTAPPANPPLFKDPVAPPSTTPVAPPSTTPIGLLEFVFTYSYFCWEQISYLVTACLGSNTSYRRGNLKRPTYAPVPGLSSLSTSNVNQNFVPFTSTAAPTETSTLPATFVPPAAPVMSSFGQPSSTGPYSTPTTQNVPSTSYKMVGAQHFLFTT